MATHAKENITELAHLSIISNFNFLVTNFQKHLHFQHEKLYYLGDFADTCYMFKSGVLLQNAIFN